MEDRNEKRPRLGTKDENEPKLSSIIELVLPHVGTAQSVCYISQVCKTFNTIVQNNDTIWHSIALSNSTFCFVPSTKLPSHTWKQVYAQMLTYKSEMAEEKKRYAIRIEEWDKHYGGYACGMRAGSPQPAKKKIDPNTLPSELVGGFKEHPGKCRRKVLPFSVDLMEYSLLYLNLLIEAKAKNITTDENLLSQALRRYVNFLHLKHKYKNHLLIPTLDIEYVWVNHMLRPSKYHSDCTKFFGEVIDHDLLLKNSYAYLNKATALQETNALYQKEFNEVYCSEELIEKQRQLPHFTPTGAGPLDADNPDPEGTSIGAPFSYPKENTFVTSAPSYVGELGNMKGAQVVDKTISLRVSDILMDGTWLDKFDEYMQSSLRSPTNTMEVRKSETSYYNPGRMRSTEVYANVWKAYEKFLFMAAKYPPAKGHYVHPSYAIDVFWHAHMICPKIYFKESNAWVGYLVDHEPWPDCEKKDMKQSEDSTNELWQKEFGLGLHEEHKVRVQVEGDKGNSYGNDYWPLPDISLPDDDSELYL